MRSRGLALLLVALHAPRSGLLARGHRPTCLTEQTCGQNATDGEGGPGALLPVTSPALLETADSRQAACTPSALVCAESLSQNQPCIQKPDLKWVGGVLLTEPRCGDCQSAPQSALQPQWCHREEEQSQGRSASGYYIWDAALRALSQLSPLILIKTSLDGRFPLHRHRDGASRRSRPQSHSCGEWNHREAALHPPGARPARALPGNSTHLLGIVAIQVHLDSRVWNLLVDSDAFQENPWTRSKSGNTYYTGAQGLRPKAPRAAFTRTAGGPEPRRRTW